MHTLSGIILLFFIQTSLGCHSAHHGAAGLRPQGETQGGFGEENNLNEEDRIRQKLSGHGLPSSIVNCVVNKMEANGRKKRSLWDDFGPRIPGGPGQEARTIEEECQRNKNLCENVLICANEQNIEIPQLSFLTPAPPPTTTTTTTASTTLPPPPPVGFPDFPGHGIPDFPKFPGIPKPDFPKFPGPVIPDIPKLPGFPGGFPNIPGSPRNKPQIPATPDCRGCSGFVCAIRCSGKRR